MSLLKNLHALNAAGSGLGPELVSDPGFNNPAGIWTTQGSSFISEGIATVYPMGALNVTANNWAVYGDFLSSYLGQTITIKVQFDARDTVLGGGAFQVGLTNYSIDFNIPLTNSFTTYTYNKTLTVPGTSSNFTRLAFGGPISSSIFEVDNVSIRLIL
jgi:hypothetical protein